MFKNLLFWAKEVIKGYWLVKGCLTEGYGIHAAPKLLVSAKKLTRELKKGKTADKAYVLHHSEHVLRYTNLVLTDLVLNGMLLKSGRAECGCKVLQEAYQGMLKARRRYECSGNE